MTRGQNKCIIMVEYKGKEEDVYIPPNDFDKTFEQLGIHSGGQITLIEMRMRKDLVGDDSDGGSEGGEDDMEDMEADLEDNAEEEGDGDAVNEGQQQDDSAVKEGGAAELSSPTTGNVAAVNSVAQPFVP